MFHKIINHKHTWEQKKFAPVVKKYASTPCKTRYIENMQPKCFKRSSGKVPQKKSYLKSLSATMDEQHICSQPSSLSSAELRPLRSCLCSTTTSSSSESPVVPHALTTSASLSCDEVGESSSMSTSCTSLQSQFFSFFKDSFSIYEDQMFLCTMNGAVKKYCD